MTYYPWRGELLGFVLVDESYVWTYESLRKWRSYDYCVELWYFWKICWPLCRVVIFLKDLSPLTPAHDHVWIVKDDYDDFISSERLFIMKTLWIECERITNMYMWILRLKSVLTLLHLWAILWVLLNEGQSVPSHL